MMMVDAESQNNLLSKQKLSFFQDFQGFLYIFSLKRPRDGWVYKLFLLNFQLDVHTNSVVRPSKFRASMQILLGKFFRKDLWSINTFTEVILVTEDDQQIMAAKQLL